MSSATGSLSEDKVKSVEAALDKGNNSAKSSCWFLFLNYKELSSNWTSLDMNNLLGENGSIYIPFMLRSIPNKHNQRLLDQTCLDVKFLYEQNKCSQTLANEINQVAVSARL